MGGSYRKVSFADGTHSRVNGRAGTPGIRVLTSNQGQVRQHQNFSSTRETCTSVSTPFSVFGLSAASTTSESRFGLFNPARMSEHEEDEAGSRAIPRGQYLPLNSKRLTAAHLRQIASALDLPTTGAADQLRQVRD